MNSNPYAVPAIVACALILIACITGLYWVSTAQRPAGGRHARPHHGKHEPAGTGEPDWLDEDEADIGWWGEQPPPSEVEVLTGPGTRIAATSDLTLGVLTRVRDSLAALGPAQPAADDPEATGEIPHAVGTWGKTPAEVAAELAAKYLTAPAVRP